MIHSTDDKDTEGENVTDLQEHQIWSGLDFLKHFSTACLISMDVREKRDKYWDGDLAVLSKDYLRERILKQ